MLISFWSVKGGSGTTVVAAAHALHRGRHHDVLLVDLDGDLPAVLGTPASGPGVTEWLAAADDTSPTALDRLCVPVADRVRLLPRGSRSAIGRPRTESLVAFLRSHPGVVVVDAGCRPSGVAAEVVDGSHESIAVTRACYLALNRLRESERRPTGVVVVREPGRSYGVSDIAAVAGPVLAEVPHERAVARSVDAGLLRTRLPRALGRLALPLGVPA